MRNVFGWGWKEDRNSYHVMVLISDKHGNPWDSGSACFTIDKDIDTDKKIHNMGFQGTDQHSDLWSPQQEEYIIS
jgi:hypothetical protein